MKELEPKSTQNKLPIIDYEVTSKLFSLNAPFAEPLDHHYSPLIKIMHIGNTFSGLLNELMDNCDVYGLRFIPCLVGMRATIEPFCIDDNKLMEQLQKITHKQRELATNIAKEHLFFGKTSANLKQIPDEQSWLRSYVKVVENNNGNIGRGDKIDERSFNKGAVAGFRYVQQIFS